MKRYSHVVHIIIFHHSIRLTIYKEKIEMRLLYLMIIYLHRSLEKCLYKIPERFMPLEAH
uniref:Uncharacterized protein n=1 Tax=Manihot esculenta TaxID=3983 RepID=A0A2C9W5A9_MANES